MILSICIPSYNRFTKLRDNLKSILSIESEELEVVVIDNCSDEDVSVLGINDPRVIFLKRESPVHANENVLQAIRVAHGKYVMLCMDKDRLLGEGIKDLIDVLIDNKDISCGCCELNSVNNIYNIDDNPLKKHSYVVCHPSGCFVRKDIVLKELEYLKVDSEQSLYYRNAFQIDFFLAAGMIHGKFLHFKKPLVITETPEEAARTKSYTYSAKRNNVFFEPYNKIQQFKLYFDHINHLGIMGKEAKTIVHRLCRQLYNDCTLSYFGVMKNKSICNHYMIESRTLTKQEILFGANMADKEINDLNMGFLEKICIIAYCRLKLYLKLIILIMKGEFK